MRTAVLENHVLEKNLSIRNAIRHKERCTNNDEQPRSSIFPSKINMKSRSPLRCSAIFVGMLPGGLGPARMQALLTTEPCVGVSGGGMGE